MSDTEDRQTREQAARITVINLGLFQIGAAPISTLSQDASASMLERRLFEVYGVWRDNELCGQRWCFSLDEQTLQRVSGRSMKGKPNAYALPPDALRPVNRQGDEWELYGKHLYSALDPLTVLFQVRVSELDWPVYFKRVMGCRVALECCELLTQARDKLESARVLYREALLRAGRQNAFIVSSEPTDTGQNSTWWEQATRF